jgi:hypothetical protein
LNNFQQNINLKGLYQIIVGTQTHGINNSFFIIMGAHHDDDHLRVESLDLFQPLNPAHTRKSDIKEHKIRRIPIHCLNRSLRRWKGFDMIGLLECQGYYIPYALFIINHVYRVRHHRDFIFLSIESSIQNAGHSSRCYRIWTSCSSRLQLGHTSLNRIYRNFVDKPYISFLFYRKTQQNLILKEYRVSTS